MKKISIVLVLFFICIRVGAAEESLIIGMGGSAENERVFRIGENLLSEISKRTGVKMQLIALPAKRATKMLRNGTIHGELSRIAQYKKEIPSAIKVEEPIASLIFYAYSSSLKKITVNGWKSLKPYKIVFIRGHVFVETHLNNQKIYAVNSAESAFRFLQLKRADLFVIDSLTASSFLSFPDFDHRSITKLEPPVDILNTYTFFSSKYSDFAKRYSKALVEMKKEGIHKKIMMETK